MINCEIEFRFDESQEHRASAVFIRGESDAWLRALEPDERTGGQVDLSDLSILPVAGTPDTALGGAGLGGAGLGGAGLTGALVFNFKQDVPRHVLSHGAAYRCVHPRLFVPASALPFPDLDIDEWDALLGFELVHVWGPTFGWNSFEKNEVLTVLDLLQPPKCVEQRFDQAESGSYFVERIRSISVVEPPRIDDIIQMGQDDIGSQSDDIDQLPKPDSETDSGNPSKFGRKIMHAIGSGVNKFVEQFPANATSPTWLDKLQDWAQSKMISAGQVDQEKRNRQIAKLLDMLKNDPDQGLKYALPMNGHGHRGRGFSGNELSSRSTDFSFSSASGGAADFWEVERQQQLELMAKYRELAQREMNLNRFRRAAYVFAELIGDLPAAAKALEAGHHYRDAALLYRDRLDNPASAAECLQRGGLMLEAANLFEELKQWENAAEVYRQIEEFEKANELYRLRIDELVQSDSLVAAADLLIEKLDAELEAVALLDSAWPQSRQAVECMDRLFELYQSQGRHDLTSQWIENVPIDSVTPLHRQKWFDLMVRMAKTYPDQATRKKGLVKTEQALSTWLKKRTIDCDHFLTGYGTLFKNDRLLRRDCSRVSHHAKTCAVSVNPSRAQHDPSKQTRRIRQLTTDKKWFAAARVGSTLYVLGVENSQAKDNSVCMHRELDDDLVRVPTRFQRIHPPELAPVMFFGLQPLVAKLGLHQFLLGPVPVVAQVIESPTHAHRCDFAINGCFSAESMGFGLLPGNRFMIASYSGEELTLNTFGPNCQLLGSVGIHVDHELMQSVPLPIPLACHGQKTFVGIHADLYEIQVGYDTRVTRMETEIKALCASAHHSRLRIGVALQDSFAVAWDGIENRWHRYDVDHVGSVCMTFTAAGRLVTTSDTGRVFRFESQTPVVESQFPIQEKVVSLVTTSNAREFWLVEPDRLSLYES